MRSPNYATNPCPMARAANPPLSRDPKCGACGHPFHLIVCDHGDTRCPCAFPPVPGIYAEPLPT